LEHFVTFVTNPGESETFGPDLAFVRIPSSSGFLSCLLAKKSFWDLTRSGVVNRIVFITRTSPMASCGLVAEKTVVAKSNTVLNQYIDLSLEVSTALFANPSSNPLWVLDAPFDQNGATTPTAQQETLLMYTG
jgi:hypothetical protein